MVKSYNRYEPAASFGVIASVDANITYDSSGKHLLAPALENIRVWHVRQGICSKTLAPTSPSNSGPSLAVTAIASSPFSLQIASGYADGSIRIWDTEKGSIETILKSGHTGAVSALRYNKIGSLLASGSKDCDIILWDVVGETGLFRLRGHRDQVTDTVFLDSGNKLISSSKDKYIRVWDLDTQHCIQIVGGHHSEIWSIDSDLEERYLVSGSADRELRYYKIKHDTSQGNAIHATDGTTAVKNIELVPPHNKRDVLSLFGEVQRQSKDRVGTVRFSKSGDLLACQVVGKTKIVEIFRVLDEADAKRKAKRRIHRKKEKKSTKGATDVSENGDATQDKGEVDIPVVTASDVFKLLQTVRASKEICSISFCPITPKSSLAILALSLNNNLLEFYSIEADSSTKSLAIELQGHRSDVRSVKLSSDNSILMSTSHNAVKFWDPTTGSCLCTVDSGFGLCGLIIPQNKYSLVGTRSGDIEIFEIGSGTRLPEAVKAHGGPIKSMAAIPDGNGFVTGSEDHHVKFWKYGTKQKPGQDSKDIAVINEETLKMNDAVLAIAVSPNAQKLAVALLDCTVKVFFMDSLKLMHSLYGHRLPVLCLDISSDGDLIVTGSADKNIMIWGLDFGDCHKSLFAHSDSVTGVQFVGNTHYVFSIGKDRMVKYWDADKFELLLTLPGHHSDIWCLAVSSCGDFLVTGSHDRSIRRWDRTEEPFFIEEEKEKRLEEIMFEAAFENKYAPNEEIPEEGAVALAGKKTQETLSATDSVIEALDIAELKRFAEHEEEKAMGKSTVAFFQPNHNMMHGLSPSDFVLKALSNVRTSDLEQALLSLPFSDTLKVLSYLRDWTSYPEKVELVSRVAAILLQIHHHQLVSTPSSRPVLSDLKEKLHKKVKDCKDTIGFNLAAMEHVKQLIAMRSDALFQDAKAKLMEIRAQNTKRVEARTMDMGGGGKRRKKKQKKSNDDNQITIA